MTDRELLELAAKAAGIALFVWGAKGAENFTIKNPDGTPGDRWNPLTDDGDALRLAVKLGITISSDNPANESEAWCYAPSVEVCIKHGADPLAATRRAIVRAAAELGKALA